MKIAFEIPLAHLQEFRPALDFGFVLCHLALKHPKYTEFYATQFDELILDNSAFELGHPVPAEDMFAVAKRLLSARPKKLYIATPDVYGSSTKTYNQCLDFISEYLRNQEISAKAGLMLVIHGGSASELQLCAEMLLGIVYGNKRISDWIVGIPYVFPHVRELTSHQIESARAALVSKLMRIVKLEKIHLLGCADPGFIPFYNSLGLRSIDTTFPVLMGVLGRKMCKKELHAKPEDRLDFGLSLTDDQLRLVKYNLGYFRRLSRWKVKR